MIYLRKVWVRETSPLTSLLWLALTPNSKRYFTTSYRLSIAASIRAVIFCCNWWLVPWCIRAKKEIQNNLPDCPVLDSLLFSEETEEYWYFHYMKRPSTYYHETILLQLQTLLLDILTEIFFTHFIWTSIYWGNSATNCSTGFKLSSRISSNRSGKFSYSWGLNTLQILTEFINFEIEEQIVH